MEVVARIYIYIYMDIYVVGFGGSKYIGEKEKIDIYIYISVEMWGVMCIMLLMVLLVLSKAIFVVGCTHKCWKYKWKWNGGIHGYT